MLNTLLLRSLRHYWRWHVGLALAVGVAAAVISGSLAVGDSVRATLARRAAERLGHVQSVVIGGDHFFTEKLAAAAPQSAGVIVVRGTVSTADGSQRVGGVNIVGVTDHFWQLALAPAAPALGEDAAAANPALARALGAAARDGLVVRMEKPSVLSKDAPLSGESDQTSTLRVTLAGTVGAAALGDFSLAANQTEPRNLFVPLARLQTALEQPGRVNLLVSRAASVQSELAAAWTLDDAGLALTKVDALNQWDLATTRVFLDPALERRLREVIPAAEGVLTYMVNEIRGSGPGVTPYSMATAAQAPFALGENEVALTQWTAEDIGAKAGDTISVAYYHMGRGRQLETRTAQLTVKDVLPMSAPSVRRDWTPPFPGIMDAPSCRDWRPGVDMDMTKIRKKDEDYWSEFKGTPKFFVSLPTGQKLWANRFGSVTGLRLPADAVTGADDLLAKLRPQLTLADLGLTAAQPAEAAKQAVDQSYDLGGLFLGMSFFLIVTALLLVGLMFLFNLESRAGQLGTLMAVGVPARRVRRWLVAEAGLVALLGSAVGLVGGVFYTQWVLGALSGEWSGAVGGLSFITAFKPATLAGAALGTAVLAAGTVWLAARRLLKRQPRELLAGAESRVARPSRWTALFRWWLAPVLLAAAAAVAWTGRGNPPAFFGAGSLLMLAGLAAIAALLRHWQRGSEATVLAAPWHLGLRNTTRRPGRSLAVAGLLAAGVFMISAMDAFQLDASRTASDRASGTGGFAFVGESSLPIYETVAKAADLEPDDLPGVSVVAARVRAGDEASCLNLQRPQNPRVLGLNGAELQHRGAFSFAAGAKDWSVLDAWDGSGPVPAVMDANYVRYTLKAALGDTLNVRDDRGGTAQLRIAALLDASVLQGSAVISETAFETLFPETGGYQFFLVDAPANQGAQTSKTLTRALENRGLALEPAADRLNAYNAVQNTYLRIFSALGGLGLILSTAGLGLLLARNVLERRAEFGVLQAVGLKKRALRHIVLGENAFLLLTGLAIGIVSALLAVWPVSRGASLPLGTLAAILVCGLLFCTLAAHLTLRGRLIEAIRSE